MIYNTYTTMKQVIITTMKQVIYKQPYTTMIYTNRDI